MIESWKWLRRLAALAAMSFVVVGTSACSDDEGPEEEPEIGQIRLLVGAVTILSVSEQPPTTAVVIPRGTHTVTVTAMQANGQIISLGSDFELRIASSNSAVISFTRTGAFTGTMNAATAGTANLTVEVFHLGEGHADYRIATLPVTVQ